MEKKIYIVLASFGLVLPYSQFVLFLLENGFNFIDQRTDNWIPSQHLRVA
jgi:hypothetical protein